MEALLYFNLTKKTASESLTGSRFRFPVVTFGEDLTVGMRYTQRFGTTVREVERTLVEVRAGIGPLDARPTSGQWGFEIDEGSGDTVSSLAFDISAADLATAINGISTPSHGLGTATVTLENGSWFVEFANETLTTYPSAPHVDFIAADYNSLAPESFLRHRTFSRNNKWVHELRLIQSPIAFTDQSTLELPDAPTITGIQDGFDDGNDNLRPEIQKLDIPVEFRGVYQIRRGSVRSSLLDISDGIEQISEALQPLADAGGSFIVTNPQGSEVLIEFAGDMNGINHDLMTVEVFSEPPGDPTFTLSLDTEPLANLLRATAADSITLPIEIEATFEDEDDDSITYTRTLLADEIEIRKQVNWEDLATAANINWLKPPLPDRRVPYDYSAVSNGQLHYSTTEGDTVATSFVVNHNLDAQDVDVVVKDISSGALLVLGTDFSVTISNTNSLTVTSLVGAPDTDDWRITVLGLEETSAFDPHTHPISEITNLQATLDSLGSRLSAIETRTGVNPITTESAEDEGTSASWVLPEVFEVYPTRQTISDPGRRIVSIKPSSLARPGGLLAAVHDASVEAMPSTVPTPASEYIGRVFENQGSTDISLPGGKRIRTNTLEPGQFAACDGRLWYPVARYGDQTGVTFTTDFATDANQLDAVQNELSNNTVVQLTTTGTLPTGLSTGTDYYVVNRSTDSVELATTSGGTPITLTGDGTGTHTITKLVESSYYPTNFERELFRIHVNSNQLRLRKRLDLRFALEAAVLRANTNALWTAVIEVGERTQATAPATTGENLAGITWRGEPLLEQQIVVTPVSSVHRLGLRITRSLVSDVDTLTTSALLYGAFEGGKVSPNNNNFVLRGRLIRFDTEDNESDPLGYTVIRGLKVDSEVGASVSTIEGTAIIS